MHVKKIFLALFLATISLGNIFATIYETTVVQTRYQKTGKLYVLLAVDDRLSMQDLFNRGYNVSEIIDAYRKLGESSIASRFLIDAIKMEIGGDEELTEEENFGDNL